MVELNKRLLVLGGTGEARAIVDEVVGKYKDVEVFYSIAGLTENPILPEGAELLRGGFGGEEGLESFIVDRKISAVINATHPFATVMTRRIYDIANRLGIPLLRVEREVWEPEEGDNWSEVQDMESASFYVPRFGSRCMLSIGSRYLELFSRWTRVFFLIRLLDTPSVPQLPLENYGTIVSRDILGVEEEVEILRKYEIDILVTRNSGGASTASRLLAARELGLPVIMLKRPPSLGGETAGNFQELMDWCAGVFV